MKLDDILTTVANVFKALLLTVITLSLPLVVIEQVMIYFTNLFAK
ncbi:hypothetical protein [Lactobacillus intestinalis]